MLTLDRTRDILSDAAGRRFDPQQRSWSETTASSGEPVSLAAAVNWLQHESKHPLRAPIAVIGPRDASSPQYDCAETMGAGLAEMGLAVACGGRTGVMEAVCRGVSHKGGIAIGILPDADPGLANPYVSVALATGIGEARNALVARAGICLVAIGNSYGTLSEVALGLQFGKPVFGLMGAAQVDGVVHCPGPAEALQAVARCVLALP